MIFAAYFRSISDNILESEYIRRSSPSLLAPSFPLAPQQQLKVFLMSKFIAAFLVALLSISHLGLANAGQIIWKFSSFQYDDYQHVLPPIVHGLLTTDDTRSPDDHFRVIEISGYYGSDQIIGLASRASRPWDLSFPSPDNSVSVNAQDLTSGCQPGGSPMPDSRPHFSCAGLSFRTQMGTVNLVFGGAAPFVHGYQDEWIMANHTIDRMASIPEPGSLSMMLLGIISCALLRAKSHVVKGEKLLA